MDPRTLNILEAIIQEFIETGVPVSSEQIYRKHRFDVKPATIRNEMHALSEGDFLEQPYTSGGRVPTDKAYRFFVDRVFEGLSEKKNKRVDSVGPLRERLESGAMRGAVSEVAESLGAVSVGYAEPGTVVKSGLDELIDELINFREVSRVEEIASIVHDIEMIDERMESIAHMLGGGHPHVFIGKSPITRSPHLSVIADTFEVRGRPFVLAVVGSKRMDYETNIRFFMNLKNYF